MRIEILKDIVALIAGEKARGIVDLLFQKKNVNEFLIAKKLNLTINQTRNVLYKLADEGIVGFIRKKDRKKGGWYTYFWTLNQNKSLFKFKDFLTKKMNELHRQRDIKKSEKFFHCINCGFDTNEENALLYEYTCPECGEILHMKDNTKEIVTLEKESTRLNGMFKEVDVELALLQQKEEKARLRKLKAEQKERMKEKEARKKQRERERKKLLQKSKQKMRKAMKARRKQKITKHRRSTKKKQRKPKK